MSVDQQVARFGPTSGVLTGIIGVAASALVLAIALIGDVTTVSLRVALVAAAVGVLIWAYMLRPRIVLDRAGGSLLLRGPLVDRRVPLAAVKVVAVRMVTTVKTEDARYDCIAVGYPIRKMVRGMNARDGQPGRLPSTRPTDQPLQDVMVDQILAAADRAREERLPDSPVRRSFAWPEIVALGLLALGFLATFVG